MDRVGEAEGGRVVEGVDKVQVVASRSEFIAVVQVGPKPIC